MGEFDGGSITVAGTMSEPEPIQSVKIGDITPLRDGVGGELSALDSHTLRVTNFRYPGDTTDTFFLASTVGSPWTISVSQTAILAHPYRGIHYSYWDSEAPVL